MFHLLQIVSFFMVRSQETIFLSTIVSIVYTVLCVLPSESCLHTVMKLTIQSEFFDVWSRGKMVSNCQVTVASSGNGNPWQCGKARPSHESWAQCQFSADMSCSTGQWVAWAQPVTGRLSWLDTRPVSALFNVLCSIVLPCHDNMSPCHKNLNLSLKKSEMFSVKYPNRFWLNTKYLLQN